MFWRGGVCPCHLARRCRITCGHDCFCRSWPNTTSGFGLGDVIVFKGQNLLTKFRRHISIYGCDVTTSGLEKLMSVILEFYFRFRFRPYHRNRRLNSACGSVSACQIASKSGYPRLSNDVLLIFKMAAAAAQYYFRFRIG